MFSGIVEAKSTVVQAEAQKNSVRVFLTKPVQFNDISIGDSISTNGVCLTVEVILDDTIQFTLGEETLYVTGWAPATLQNKTLNLERSLKFGDRIHGHLVSGHVDTMATVTAVENGDSWFVRFAINNLDRRYVWAKGSITLNGVSLTVNKVVDNFVEVCLIPETLLRTNLCDLISGDVVTVEYDHWAKAFVNFQEQREASL